MNVRLLAGMALPVVAGFALGIATAPNGAAGGEIAPSEDKAAPARGPVSAFSRGAVSTSAMLSRVAAYEGAGGFSKLMAYMKLVRSAELGEFPELFERIQLDLDAGDMSHAEFLADMLVRRWAAEDPLGALVAVLAGDPPAMRNQQWSVLPIVADKRPREAWSAVRAMEHRGRRRNLERDLMQQIAGKHPKVALELLAELNPTSDRELLKRGLGRVAKHLPLEALALAESLPVGALGTRGTVRFKVGGEYRSSRHLASGAGEAAALVAGAWAQADPAAAVAWAEAQEGSRRESTLSATVGEWAKRDPEAALAYGSGSSWHGEVLDKVLGDQRLAIARRRELAEAQGGPPQQSLGYYSLTQHWIREDAATLGAWLAERPGRETNVLMDRAAANWAAHNQAEAAVGVVEIGDPEMRRIAIEAVAKRLRANVGLGLYGVPEIEMAPEVRAAYEALGAKQEGGTR